MSPEMTRRLFKLFLVFMAFNFSTEAQNQTKKLSRSPFLPRSHDHFQQNSIQFHKPLNRDRNVQHTNDYVHKSPLTTTRDRKMELTTQSVEATTLKADVAQTKAARDVHQEPQPKSPFSPPSAEWRNQNEQQWRPREQVSSWLNALEERQRKNADSIPPLADIVVSSKGEKSSSSSTDAVRINSGGERKSGDRRAGKRPKLSAYQYSFHNRDMHETGPGATPWTRYTEKPKLSKDGQDSKLGKMNARCGPVRYSPRNQICCEGQVVRRRGMNPACCGTDSFDMVFSKCCNGVVTFRSDEEPDC